MTTHQNLESWSFYAVLLLLQDIVSDFCRLIKPLSLFHETRTNGKHVRGKITSQDQEFLFWLVNMSISNVQNNITRLSNEMARLEKLDANEASTEANLIRKLNRAEEAALRATSDASRKSKIREIERATEDIARSRHKRADISNKRSNIIKNLNDYKQRLAREEKQERKKIADEEKRLIRDRAAYEKRITRRLLSTIKAESKMTKSSDAAKNYDFFISHASEDKDDIVSDLAHALDERGAKVWYDDKVLRVGDSLRRSIDNGLSESRFGVVILSQAFFGKSWPNKELDGLVSLETEGRTRILPIWHKVSKDEVASYSPTLADKVALNTGIMSLSEIADDLMRFIEPSSV